MLFYKTLQHKIGQADNSTLTLLETNNVTTIHVTARPQPYAPILPDYLQLDDRHNLKDLLFFTVTAVVSSLLVFHIVCGYLEIYYYVLQRGSPERWKCQPERFLTRSNELHEVVVGTVNMAIGGLVSGFLACWVMNDNYSTFYFKIDQHGYTYFFFTIFFVFFWIEATAFYYHKLLHTPYLYKLIHKQHHRYHSPTPYSLVAMSPFEMLCLQGLFLIPVFIVPIHAFVFIAIQLYVFYYGMMDHSGIMMEALWPWQPNTKFHDDHHK